MRVLEEPERSSQLNAGEMSWAEKALPLLRCVNKLPGNLVLFVKHPKDAWCGVLESGIFWRCCNPGLSLARSTEQQWLVLTSLAIFLWGFALSSPSALP